MIIGLHKQKNSEDAFFRISIVFRIICGLYNSAMCLMAHYDMDLFSLQPITTKGLGSAVSEILAETGTARLVRVGIMDRFGCSGKREDLKKYFGLDWMGIVKAFSQFENTGK